MPPPSKYLPADERRAVTVTAVIELAAQQNPSEITTAAIAQHMSVTQGSLFRHFANKEAILESVMHWVAKRLLARIDKAMQGQDTAIAALRAAFMSHIQFISDHPGVPRLLFSELQRKENTAAKKLVNILLSQYQQRLQHTLEQGKQDQELDAQLDVAAAATLFIGSIQGLVVQSIVLGNSDMLLSAAQDIFVLYQRAIEAR
ncbi:MAG: TetR/AcrR family transcriptional regulator [Pseudomonas sp.]|jgi:AcrR family transcriptional regulator|nr:TetR/AcrR family transcriptional regulator [Pseudomonas sp.]MDD2222347.1 TetR/AcrR family transcriptional regulator [Pseudomonas sp.]MDY0413619.1 TetR/AcrR family transcriptional regulator [Pseudomonas sp.]NLO54740.1 TetR/AcrR family transcriptional regulator [Gammaproteobacteria bacterium]